MPTTLSIGTYGWSDTTSIGIYGWANVSVISFVGHPKIARKLALQNILTFSQAVMSRIQLVCRIADKQTLEASLSTKQLLKATCSTSQATKAILQTRTNIKVNI